MRIGLISDTHGLLRPEVFTIFEDVDLILHAGDVGGSDILIELRAIAPVTAVWGNTDGSAIREMLTERAELEIEGKRVKVVHGHQIGSPTARRIATEYPEADLVVYGHSHQPEIEKVGSVLAVNPGSAGPRRFTLPVTVAIATVSREEVSARLVQLTHLRNKPFGPDGR